MLTAENLDPGEAAFNLACLSALVDEEEDCLTWLQICVKHGKMVPDVDELMSDSDLKRFCDRTWFKDLLKVSGR